VGDKLNEGSLAPYPAEPLHEPCSNRTERRMARLCRVGDKLMNSSAAFLGVNADKVQNQSKSNNNQDINKTGSVQKFNQGTVHNNLSSSLADSNIVNVANDKEYVKRRTTCLSEPGYFVSIDEAIPQDIKFNWWVIK